jgi:5-methylcytosine-specific restriction endonuclease McrA
MNLSMKKYRELKNFVYGLDGGKCHICKKPVDYTETVLDHIVPLARSGNGGELTSDEYWNLRIAHRKCNIVRSNAKTGGQLRLKILD